MTNDIGQSANTEEEERSFGKSVIYWLGVYAITIPLVIVVTGLIVKAALGWSSPY